MCGIVGVSNHKQAATIAFLGLYALQHRGEEAAGIATFDGKDVNIAGSNLEGFVVLFAFIAVAYTFLVSAGMLSRPPAWLGWIVDPQTRSMLVAILVFGIIVWFITKEEKPLDKRKPVHETIKDLFGGTLK